MFLNLKANQEADLVISNILGQVVWKKRISGNGKFECSPDINKGVYMVSLCPAEGVYSKKVFFSGK
jgi:hypothetical protein